MASTCKHCGAEPHESRKRTFACGTTSSGTGNEYQTESCKLITAANARRDAALVECNAALADRDRYKAEMERAQVSEAEARELAINAQKYVYRANQQFREATLAQLKSILFPEPAPEESATA